MDTMHRGMESQTYTASRPGRPVRKKEVLEWLEWAMTFAWEDSKIKCNLRIRVQRVVRTSESWDLTETLQNVALTTKASNLSHHFF